MNPYDELARQCEEVKVCTRCAADLEYAECDNHIGDDCQVCGGAGFLWKCPNAPHPTYTVSFVEEPIELWIVGFADRFGNVDLTRPYVSYSDPELAEQECERRNMEEP